MSYFEAKMHQCTLGELTALPLADFRGRAFKGKDEERRGEGIGREGKGET